MKKRNIMRIIAFTCCLALLGCKKSEQDSEPKSDINSSQQTSETKNAETKQPTSDAQKPSSLSKKASPGEWFTFDKRKDDEVQVSGHTFSLKDENVTEIVIPDSHEGKTVTAIGANAFYYCNFTSAIIPDSVNLISRSKLPLFIPSVKYPYSGTKSVDEFWLSVDEIDTGIRIYLLHFHVIMNMIVFG